MSFAFVLLSIEAIHGFYVFFISAQEKISIQLRKLIQAVTEDAHRVHSLNGFKLRWNGNGYELESRPLAQHFTFASSLFFIIVFRP
jgi:hypothetical protein